GDLLLALHRPPVGLRDRPGRRPGGRDRRAPALRRLLGQQGRGPAADHRARLRRRQLADQGLHTRGTFDGFKQIGSPRKWLDAHGGKKWGYYYAPESLRRQQVFFDHFLKGADTELSGWPAVSYEVRDRAGASARKSASGWPLPGTSYERLFLDA